MGCWKRVKDCCLWPGNWAMWAWFVIILVGSLVLLGFISDPTLWDGIPDYHKGEWASKDSAEVYAYWLTGVATALLVVVACVQIAQVIRDGRAKFFLQIDKRWTSTPILQAKKIINSLEAECGGKHGVSQQNKIGDEIFKILHVTKPLKKAEAESRGEKSAVLINFLDLMETIGFLWEGNYIKFEEADKVCGEFFACYYAIFRRYIEQEREKRNDQDIYGCFERLAKEAHDREEKKSKDKA